MFKQLISAEYSKEIKIIGKKLKFSSVINPFDILMAFVEHFIISKLIRIVKNYYKVN